MTQEPAGSRETVEIRKSYSRIPPQTDDQLREIIANTYGQIALVDHNIGRILIALDEAGLAENTIVVYISDHGDWLGDHGLILKGPMHYEGLLRVPMIVRGPGIPEGARIEEPVSTLDLTPTFCAFCAFAETAPLHVVRSPKPPPCMSCTVRISARCFAMPRRRGRSPSTNGNSCPPARGLPRFCLPVAGCDFLLPTRAGVARNQFIA